MKQPLVSIIIPTFNRAHLIGETLDSVLAQTYTSWECIVVDDGSIDNTNEILKAFCDKDPRFKYVNRPDTHKPGGNGARNYGFELSKGEYVNWFDSDDLMHPEKLETQVESLHNSSCHFSVCQTLVFEGSKDNILGLRHERIFSENALEDFIKRNIVFLTQAPLFRKSFLVYNKLFFNEELKAAQEWEFICRVMYYSPLYKVDETSLVLIRKHEDSISYNEEGQEEREWNYYLARVKIFDFYKIKQKAFSNEIQLYFKKYFFKTFTTYLKVRNKEKTYLVFEQSIISYLAEIKVIKIRILLFFYFITGNGYENIKKTLVL